MGLDRFHLVLVNSDCNRPLNGFDGNHQRTVSVACGQESFDAVQRATTNSHALTRPAGKDRVRTEHHSTEAARRFSIWLSEMGTPSPRPPTNLSTPLVCITLYQSSGNSRMCTNA